MLAKMHIQGETDLRRGIRSLRHYGLIGMVAILSIIGIRGVMYNERVESRLHHAAKYKSERTSNAPQASDKGDYQPSSLRAGLALSSTSSDALAQKPQPKSHQLQLGLHFLAHWAHEDPFIDRMKLQGYPDDWKWVFNFQNDFWNTAKAAEKGFIDPISGDLLAPPPGTLIVQSPMILPGHQKFPEHYRGEWVFEWTGRAEASLPLADINVLSNERTEVNAQPGGKLIFRMPPRPTKETPRIHFRNVKGPLGALRLYRQRDATLLANGAIWAPEFVNLVRRYEVIRTMLPQDINETPITRWAEVATPQDTYFIHREPVPAPAQRPQHGRYGIPYEWLLDLAIQTDTDLWLHVPLQIGSDRTHHDTNGNADQLFSHALRNGQSIIESPAWDEYADELAKRIMTSGYPKDRPLYVELGNEVWNFAWAFTLATRYSDGIGKSFSMQENYRYGYGALTARLTLALEKALTDSGYKPTYIIASQTANPQTTTDAYRGFRDYLSQKNVPPSRLLPRTGVALTTYHGGADAYRTLIRPRSGESLVDAWEREIRNDPSGLRQRLHDHYTQSPANIVLTKNWIVNRWKAHQKAASEFGAALIGAYEGGSHDQPPPELAESETFLTWWRDYHWGPMGSDVVRQVNQEIIDAFPGVILSNFIGVSESGLWQSPWNDGHYGEQNAMIDMWKEFQSRK